MFRTVLAILLLLLLATAVWYGGRWLAEREDLHVTVILESAGELQPGDPVTAGGIEIGRVREISEVESRDAVSIVVKKEHRNELLRDSLFSVRGSGDATRLEVVNAVAVGAPLPDGAVVQARDDKVSRWLAEHGTDLGAALSKLESKARRLIEEYESGELTRQLEEYQRKLPEWKDQGDEIARKKMTSISRKVDQAERALREHGRVREADQLRKRFEQWRAEVEAGAPEKK